MSKFNEVWNLCCPSKVKNYLTNKTQISFVYTQCGYECHSFVDDGFIYRIVLDEDEKLFIVYKVELGVDCTELVKTSDISLVKERLYDDISQRNMSSMNITFGSSSETGINEM